MANDWLDIATWAVPTWLFLVGAWVTYAALFRDRARGRLRCPKCWYDRAGASSGPCPECGHTVKKARRLRKTRRRWRWGVVGLVMLAAVWPSRYVLRVQQVGWVEALPTAVLLSPMSPLSEYEVDRELLSRVMRGDLAYSKYNLYKLRCFGPRSYPITRPQWADGQYVSLRYPYRSLPSEAHWEWRLHRPRGTPRAWVTLDERQQMTAVDDGRIDLSVIVGEQRIWRTTMEVFEPVPPAISALRPIAMDPELLGRSRFSLWSTEAGMQLLADWRGGAAYAHVSDDCGPRIAFGSRVRFYRDGVQIGHGTFRAMIEPRKTGPHRAEPGVWREMESALTFTQQPSYGDRIEVEFIADRAEAENAWHYAMYPTCRWAGTHRATIYRFVAESQ